MAECVYSGRRRLARQLLGAECTNDVAVGASSQPVPAAGGVRDTRAHDGRSGGSIMSVAAAPAVKRGSETKPAVPRPEVRHAVKDLLLRSKAFASLPPNLQQEIAHHTTEIADYLAAPEGIRAD